MKEKNKTIQKSKLSDLREIHGMTVLSNLRNINGQSAVQVDALLQAACENSGEWPC